MQIEMHLNDGPFTNIKSGKQRIEARICDEKRGRVKVGDIIVFIRRGESRPERFNVEVVGLLRFASFTEMFRAIPLPQLFGNSDDATIQEQVSTMHKYYSEDEEKALGVIGICIRLLK